MKTTKIQFNAKDFKDTRDVLNGYFGAKYDLAIELDKTRKATDDLRKVIATDKEQLDALTMGKTEIDGAKIIRTIDAVRNSYNTNVANYNAMVAPYNAMVEATSEAIAKAVALFSNKDSVLYKAYVAYVTEPTDDNYNAYADAMAKRFVELGLKDATADNVAHYMPNADKELRGKTAVKRGDIRGAIAPSQFANAVLGKIYTNNRNNFASKKFADYVRKCAEKATKNK